MVDRFGLLTDAMPNLLPFQNKLVQKRENSAAGIPPTKRSPRHRPSVM